MDNSVTLFLLFLYSAVIGGVAFKLLIYDRRRARDRNEALEEYRRERNMSRSESLLARLSDSEFNAQLKVTRVVNNVKIKESAGEKTPEQVFDYAAPAGSACDAMASERSGTLKADNKNEKDAPVKYEIDEATLDLIVKTVSYDDFAQIYEKFLHASSEDEVCELIPALESFVEDERLIMILSPLLSHESRKVQKAARDFISKTEKFLITNDMLTVMENSDYLEKQKQSENLPLTNEEKVKKFVPGIPAAAQITHEIAMPQGAVMQSVTAEPHKLILEAYQTNDHDRLFEISCALSTYDDPYIVDALLYINSKLNGEIAAEEPKPKRAKIIKAPLIKKQAEDTFGGKDVKKFEFNSVNDIFRPQADDITMRRTAPAKEAETSQSNDYVKGMKLVNHSKYSPFFEAFPELTNNLNHDSSYVRCCSILGLKTLAQRCHSDGMYEERNQAKEALLSHMVFEKNSEVSGLCAKAGAEIESFVKMEPASGSLDSGETRPDEFRQVNTQFQNGAVQSLFYKNASNS